MGATGGCFIVSGCSQAAYLLSSSSCLFSIPPLLLHSIHFIVFFFTGCQAPGPASPMGTRTTPTDARAQGCGAAVPAKPRVPSVRVLSCVGDLRSGKQKLHVSTGWGGKATSLQASVAGPEETERVSWSPRLCHTAWSSSPAFLQPPQDFLSCVPPSRLSRLGSLLPEPRNHLASTPGCPPFLDRLSKLKLAT